MPSIRWSLRGLPVMPMILVAATALCASAAIAQPGAADIESGRALYLQFGCYSCHGTVGQGGERSAAPRIAPGPHPFEAFRAMVRQPREAMPRYDARFVSDDQLRLMHAYLAAVPKGRAAKDIAELQVAPPGAPK